METVVKKCNVIRLNLLILRPAVVYGPGALLGLSMLFRFRFYFAITYIIS